jgi:hypothetical protein
MCNVQLREAGNDELTANDVVIPVVNSCVPSGDGTMWSIHVPRTKVISLVVSSQLMSQCDPMSHRDQILCPPVT